MSPTRLNAERRPPPGATRRCRAVLLAGLATAWLAAAALPAAAVDHVVMRRDDRERHVSGKLLVTAEDGGLLVLAADGVLWSIEPQELVRHEADATPFQHHGPEAVAAALRKELPDGFQIHTTAHYVVCYNTSRAYAQWCGALYERLYRAFTNFWSRKGFDLHEPELPLVALVFADATSYRNYARDELKEATDSIVGYYSLRTNRVTMYDLTGVESLRRPGSRRGKEAEINRILAQPAAAPMVATIVHEATHQIAFNCGLQTRYADIPLWVSEGIAVYFETPDLKSSSGWRGIGDVNRPRLATFQKNIPARGPGALAGLLSDDRRLRDARTAPDGYAEAWALNYYLIRRRPKEYVAYLQMLSKKPHLVWADAEQRLAEFKQFFGDDLERLDAEFVRTVGRLR